MLFHGECHPPLIAHNPQRTADEASYIVVEQDKRLQRIINNGSICPTTVKDNSSEVQQGNVTLLNISENGLSVIVKGIHTEKVFIDKFIEI